MDTVIENSFWQALGTEHASFSVGLGLARRYPADVLPFAAVERGTAESMRALRELMVPGETVYVEGELGGELAGLVRGSAMTARQMHFPARLAEDSSIGPPSGYAVGGVDGGLASPVVRELGVEDAAAMMALAEAAPPGFYRLRSYVLGLYFSIYIGGELVAMAGERVALPGFREISGVCTHPAHVGRGYAARLIRHLLGVHFRAGLRSFLHVRDTNARALSLYERLGFEKVALSVLHPLRRDG